MTPATTFTAAHVEASGDLVLPLPVREAFRFFTPEGERLYVPGWNPEYLHPAEPSEAPGTVFRTRTEGEETLWMVLELDPVEGVATYGRFTPGSRLGTVRVRCRPEGEGATRVTVTYTLTATSAHGNEALAAFGPGALAARLQRWREAILACLSSGAARAA